MRGERSITELRQGLADLVRAVLDDGETVSVAAGGSEYKGNLATLRFTVLVDVGEGAIERLDELLDPAGGVREAIEATNEFRVTRSAGHQGLPDDHVGSTWTAEHIV